MREHKDLFYQVIALHDETHHGWESLSQKIPFLPRGWYELSRLPVEDRIEFTRDYWLSKLLFITSSLERRIKQFFENLDDIGFFATQLKEGEPFDVHMIYSLKGGGNFLQGSPPASEERVAGMEKQFSHVDLPPDYLLFLQIHDGFSKYTDTGLIKTRDITRTYQRFQQLLTDELLVNSVGQFISKKAIMPFYESFGLHCYQCFYADWSPAKETGNIYFSEHDYTISNFLDRNNLEENQAFHAFLNWLLFYLENS